MEIIWHGQSCFTIKGANATVVTDPYSEELGLKRPKLKADLVTVSHGHFDHNHTEGIEGDPRVFDWPGEYECKGVLLTAVPSFHYAESEGEEGKKRGNNLMFHFEIDGIRIVHLGDLGHRLTDEMIQELGDVDIVLVPIGGVYTVDHKKAHEIVEQIDPRVVIPMHYKIEGLKVEELAGLEPFAKEVGAHGEPRESYKIKTRAELPEETTEFVTLVPKLG